MLHIRTEGHFEVASNKPFRDSLVGAPFSDPPLGDGEESYLYLLSDAGPAWSGSLPPWGWPQKTKPTLQSLAWPSRRKTYL